MYELTYDFDGSGGNVQYQTKQRIDADAATAGVDAAIVSVGLSLGDDRVGGVGIVDVPADVDPDAAFESATNVRHLDALLDPNGIDDFAIRHDFVEPADAARFEAAKVPLVVGDDTHGVGEVDALFRSDGGSVLSGRDLADRYFRDGTGVHFHPLGVQVDGELYRPVRRDDTGSTVPVGEPIPVTTYRGTTGKPWQFGITRFDGQLLSTQARAGPSKFDPVLKRFPIETHSIDDESILFSHTVSRRVWSEDPANPRVQSQRSEGVRTQLLYRATDDWHLVQPTGSDTAADSGDAFESTRLDGVSVRSTVLRSGADGETTASIEREYRITPAVFDACEQLYVLSYYEANEESVDTLQWDIAEATAYEIVGDGT